jgi:hypothetical protein
MGQVARWHNPTLHTNLLVQQHPHPDFKLYFDLDVTIPCPFVDIGKVYSNETEGLIVDQFIFFHQKACRQHTSWTFCFFRELI